LMCSSCQCLLRLLIRDCSCRQADCMLAGRHTHTPSEAAPGLLGEGVETPPSGPCSNADSCRCAGPAGGSRYANILHWPTGLPAGPTHTPSAPCPHLHPPRPRHCHLAPLAPEWSPNVPPAVPPPPVGAPPCCAPARLPALQLLLPSPARATRYKMGTPGLAGGTCAKTFARVCCASRAATTARRSSSRRAAKAACTQPQTPQLLPCATMSPRQGRANLCLALAPSPVLQLS
jgi:hypothetical protein